MASYLACVFGILGNVLFFLAPLPNFYKIYKRKSTEGFQPTPYAVALFSAMLTLNYAFLKTNAILLITINSVGMFIECTYLVFFMLYATKEARTYTIKLFILFNVGAYGFITIFTLLFSHGDRRVEIVGWICAVFSFCVTVAPLSIMRLVIKTKSVEYMPFSVSFFLTLSAVMRFSYGFLKKDYLTATPNIPGFLCGIAQMILYIIYKDKKKADDQLPESITIIDLSGLEMQESSNTVNEDPNQKPIQPSESSDPK